MGGNHINSMLQFCQKIYNELEVLNTIVVITQSYLTNQEMSGQYYNSSREISFYISKERCHYINLLSILSERVIAAQNTCEIFEEEVNLHNDTNNCG